MLTIPTTVRTAELVEDGADNDGVYFLKTIVCHSKNHVVAFRLFKKQWLLLNDEQDFKKYSEFGQVLSEMLTGDLKPTLGLY